MTSKKIAAERRPFCDTRLQDTNYRRKRTLHVKRTLFVYEPAKKSEKRELNDCPFFSLKYGFDELPLDPIKDFLLEKICMYIMKFFKFHWFIAFIFSSHANGYNCWTL